MIKKLLLMSLMGGIGTLLRYWLSVQTQKISGITFPIGTLFVNITGCFLVGFLWALFEDRLLISGEMKIIILVGFMGAFTTFSSFMLETAALLRSSEWFYGIGNIMIHNTLGFAALIFGITFARNI